LAFKRKSLLTKAQRAERASVAEAFRDLTFVQRVAVDALLSSPTRAGAVRRLQANGVEVDDKQIVTWMKQPRFHAALQARADQLAARVTKSSVIVNAKNLFEEAMTPKPILFKGDDTGFQEVELGAALQANEQMAKAIGAFVPEVSGKTVVVLDIDFSGRKNPVQEIYAEDADFSPAPDEFLQESKRNAATLEAPALELPAAFEESKRLEDITGTEPPSPQMLEDRIAAVSGTLGKKVDDSWLD
jgi:hypothetical protein